MVQRIRLPEQNRVTLVGRLSQDPELRYTQKGQAVCRFNLATGRRYKDATGEWQEETSFIPVVSWQDLALRCNERLKKGSPVYVHGRLKSRNWEDKEGKKRYALEVQAREIQFLQVQDKEPAGAEQGAAEVVEAPAAAEAKVPAGDEDIPF